eukprot:SAG31_NODE_2059_length_6539_cov_4.699845_2_plen_45_part_00
MEELVDAELMRRGQRAGLLDEAAMLTSLRLFEENDSTPVQDRLV